MNQTIFDLDPDSLTGPLGAHHHARFTGQGAELLVHFATTPKGMDADQHHSPLEAQARQRGWSLLTIVAQAGHDFRADAVIGFFDRCVDGAIFDQFEQTLFYGDEDGGYAALCYALSAPGARIVSVTPKAAAQPPQARYLPESKNLAVASRLIWLHDPTSADAMKPDEAAQVLTTRFLAPEAEARLLRYGVFWTLLEGAMGGGVAPSAIYKGLRARRDDQRYIRRLLALCKPADRQARAAVIAGSYAARSGHPRYRETYRKLIEAHDLKGFMPI
ncbi:hypothetical protein [Cognatishimia sp. MH4019]|uniref:hypothetical protein n=1 Tax=Cognatishimia sp. MH4019 TaxID=2854030 RepID=UPI001CD75B37|nr:hypothetical protein [Cognatishimia sp. MH4019]